MTTLRTRLLALRADLLDRLSEAETLEPSWLGTLAGIAAALAAVDAEPAAVEIADRAVVADDGASLRLALYTADHQAVAVELLPGRAVALAAELLAAALPRLR
jgi:hypothetical protein